MNNSKFQLKGRQSPIHQINTNLIMYYLLETALLEENSKTTLSEPGFPQKQALRQRLVCREFIWEVIPGSRGVGSRHTQKERRPIRDA